ncbi:MAG: histidine phosphatase family protein [Chitinophagales bacterium]|nr:histidine phosphatase family protein [Chitinophagales bacterium]
MKTLVLVRHAKSSWSDPELADIERPLNERGQRDAPRMAQVFRQQLLQPDLMVSSTAARALATAEIFAHELKYDQAKLLRIAELYLAEADALMDFVRGVDDAFSVLMLFGHNDGLSHFANRLLDHQDLGSLPTCAVAAMDFTQDQWSRLQWHSGRIRFFFYPKLLGLKS